MSPVMLCQKLSKAIPSKAPSPSVARLQPLSSVDRKHLMQSLESCSPELSDGKDLRGKDKRTAAPARPPPISSTLRKNLRNCAAVFDHEGVTCVLVARVRITVFCLVPASLEVLQKQCTAKQRRRRMCYSRLGGNDSYDCRRCDVIQSDSCTHHVRTVVPSSRRISERRRLTTRLCIKSHVVHFTPRKYSRKGVRGSCGCNLIIIFN